MKEIQLDEKCSFQLITDLMELYQLAIEYFEDKSDPRHLEFQQRMQSMLLRPDVITQLEKANLGRRSRKLAETQVVITEPEKEEPVVPRKAKDDPNAPEKLIEVQSQVTSDALEHTRRDLKQQHTALSLRLQRRKGAGVANWKEKANTTIDSALPTGDTEINDFSIGEILDSSSLNDSSQSLLLQPDIDFPPQFLDELEDELEKIMESSFAEKAERVQTVQRKFEAQLQELETEIKASGGNKLLEQVADRMRSDMEAEVKEVMTDSVARRKEKVRELKAKYWST